MTAKKTYWISTAVGIPEATREVLNEYLLSLKVENRAETTVDKYRRELERFLQEHTVLDELTPEIVRSWLDEFSKGKKPTSIELMFYVLSSFFQFCLEEEYMETTVMKKRWKPKIPKSLPKYLDEFEFARVKQFIERLPIRNRALILFLFSTGGRVTEVSNLNIEDVDLENRTAIVVGKGEKVRDIYFSNEASLVLKAYLNTRSAKPTDPLFENKFGDRLQAGGIRKVLQKVSRKMGLKQSFHPHVCRHTYATNMLARGANIRLIARFLGHEDVNTTRIYARIPTEEKLLQYQIMME
ncbi:tyrosine-type recombinase/integrase [Sporosarcina cascadiensis]|uniref:tyrosine-type recombinase/integrase n=1 Tax=Sporosarcina cascadiensis TaxID=2660747 RepID=UPI00129A2885|nr:tyrosine-type recombinase/integrase [Sporosarcina cascadiensis]